MWNFIPFAKFASPREKSLDGNDTRAATIWGTLCHLSSLVSVAPLTILGFFGMPYVLLFPITNFLGPLLIWRFKRTRHPFINSQGKEALNFQISLSLYIVSLGLVFLLGAALFSVLALLETSPSERLLAIVTLLNVGLAPMTLIVPLVGIVDTVSVILAALKVKNGQPYRYPYSMRLVK